MWFENNNRAFGVTSMSYQMARWPTG